MLRSTVRWTCHLLGLALVAAGTLLAQAGPRATDVVGFKPVRAPLYELVIEHNAESGRYRLAKRGKTICTGSRKTCEEHMLAVLKKKYGTGKMNLRVPTMGGKQIWADEFVFAGWRIQKNVYSKHHRLLNNKDVRYAWGSFDACRVAFEEQRFARGLSVAADRAVVLLHGMGRSHHSYKKLVKHLRKDGYEVLAINYPSTRLTIKDHAAQVSRVLDRCDGIRSVSFVAHSMGGLVARELLALDAPWKKRMKPARMVMLGAPNKGSVLADRLQSGLAYRVLAGAGGQGLVTKKVAAIPLPAIPFGVIAGGRGDGKGYNPLIPGDDDGVVSVATTRLVGAADFLRVPSLHTFLMSNEVVIAATRKFLAKGKF